MQPDESGDSCQRTPGKVAEEELVGDDDGADRDQHKSDRVRNREHTEDTHSLACQTTKSPVPKRAAVSNARVMATGAERASSLDGPTS